MTATTAALISSFEHMLTVYNGTTNLENLEKIERQEVSTKGFRYRRRAQQTADGSFIDG